MIAIVDVEVLGADCAARDLRHRHARHPDGRERFLERSEVCAEIEKRADEHVAGDSRELRIEQQDALSAHVVPRRRLIFVACAAAPNPLSMLTTLTPGAHEFSMPRRAAMPPNDAP